MSLVKIFLTIVVILFISFSGCTSAEEKIKAYEDEIVVTCAEPILLDYSKIPTTPDNPEPFQIYLASAHDIFLFENKHPFKEFDNYITYKADFYRTFLGWGRLPPEDIMQKCGIKSP